MSEGIGIEHLIVAVGGLLGALATVVWWFLRYTQQQVESERETRERALENERKEREEDRHSLRGEINSVGMKLNAHELHVAKEYVNIDRLHQALKPLEDSFERIERAFVRMFDELKGKQDRG